MAAIGTAFVRVKADTKNFEKDARGGIMPAAKKLAAAFAAVFAAQKIGGFLKGAIEEASDLNENMSKTEAIFGDAAKSVQDFAGRGAKALGQTRNQVLTAAGTFGTFGKAAGLSGGDLAKFSNDFVSLSTDLASFNNTSPEEAVEAIGAALRGEAEPMRRYGVLLDDASMRQKALELGLISTTKNALTPQQKVLAAQALIMEQTSDAQGDFAKTSGGLANQQRILAAQWTDMKARIGEGLLPIVVRFATFATGTLLPGLARLGGFLKDTLGPVFGTIRDAARQVFDVLFRGDFTGGGPFEEDSGFILALFTVRDAFAQIGRFVQERVLPALATAGDFIRVNFSPAVERVGGFISGTLAPVLAQVAGFLIRTFTPTFRALSDHLSKTVLPTLRGLFERVKENLPAFVSLAKFVGALIAVAGALVAKLLGFVLPVLIRLAGFLLRTLFAAVGVVIGVIGDLILTFRDAWESAQRLRDRVGEAWEAVKRKTGEIFTAVKDAIISVFNAVRDFLAERLGNIKDNFTGVFTGVRDFVGEVFGAIRRKIGEIMDGIRDFFAERLEGFARAFGEGFAAVKEAIVAPLGGVKEVARDAFRFVVDKFLGMVETLVQGAAKAFGWVPGIGPKLKAAANEVGRFRDSTNARLEGIKDKTVTVTFKADTRAISVTNSSIRSTIGDGPGAVGGRTLARVKQMLTAGTYVTSTYRTPAENARVGGSPRSYHLDRSNPAVDIGGRTGALDQVAARLRQAGGWRELLWRTAGHYDHIHVAHDGGRVLPSWPTLPGLRSDERPAILQTGETVVPRGGGGTYQVNIHGNADPHQVIEAMRRMELLHA
jgi:hypothetical protein